jgi:ribosomal protein S18 acetylase RimI-like enzyme
MFKAFWPDVKGSYFFRNRRSFIDFMHSCGGVIYYIPGLTFRIPSFILVGNWRSRADITALWHVKGEGALKKRLVTAAASRSFAAGKREYSSPSRSQSTKLRNSGSGASKPRMGSCCWRNTSAGEPLPPTHKSRICRSSATERSTLEEVLSLDATAFDDFWKMDELTMEAVATTCHHNVIPAGAARGAVLGYTVGGTNGRFGYLQRLGIHAGHQGQGIGKRSGQQDQKWPSRTWGPLR